MASLLFRAAAISSPFSISAKAYTLGRLARRTLSPIRSMASSAADERFQKVQIQRDDTVSTFPHF